MPAGVLADDVALELAVLPQPPPALDQPRAAIARDLLGPRGALRLQRLFGLAQHPAPITARAQPLRAARRRAPRRTSHPPRRRCARRPRGSRARSARSRAWRDASPPR